MRAPLDASGPAAPPRDNGELVFEAPWQSRAFGVALALSEGGAIDFEDFRARLIEEIRAFERDHAPGFDGDSYYHRWLAALERLALDRGLVADTDLDVAARRIAQAWAHDHTDHGHGHHHHHHPHEHHHEVPDAVGDGGA